MIWRVTECAWLSAELLIANHLRLAKAALRDAALLLEAESRNTAYLAEQGVEQIVLALAQSEQIHFPRSKQHQLDSMIREIPDTNPFKWGLNDLSWLEAYATAYRYPKTKGGLVPSPDPNKVQAALTKATFLLDEVAKHFGADLNAPSDKPAIHSRPPHDGGDGGGGSASGGPPL
jgi:hypothetical protein